MDKGRGNVERKHRSVSGKLQDRLHPQVKWCLSGMAPSTRPIAFAPPPDHRFCSVSARPARRAHCQNLNHNSRAAMILCQVSMRGNAFFFFHTKQSIQTNVKWHTKGVNQAGLLSQC